MTSLAQLVLRLTVGALLAGHGAQKLFGSFHGAGIEGTADMLEPMGYQPARQWATAAGLGEFTGGWLTALGFLSPLGPLFGLCVMLTATVKAHGKKPIWVTAGGAELPVTNMAALTALTLAGPGAVSLDRLFGIKLPAWFNVLAFAGATAVTVSGILSSHKPQKQPQPTEPQEEPGTAQVKGEVRVRERVHSRRRKTTSRPT